MEEHTHAGPAFEIDVATYEGATSPPDGVLTGPALATRTAPAYAPPVPDATLPATFPDTFEVRVFNTSAGLTLVAVVELVSPGHKDRPAERRAFAAKCASYLAQGVSLIVVDIVTNRHANLHNDLMRLLEANPALDFAAGVSIYAVAYRPLRRGEQEEIDLWQRTLAVGEPLPVLPLRLTGDLFVPVDFEAAYQEACRRRRLASSKHLTKGGFPMLKAVLRQGDMVPLDQRSHRWRTPVGSSCPACHNLLDQRPVVCAPAHPDTSFCLAD